MCEYNQARLEYLRGEAGLRRPAGACFRLIFAGVGEAT
jgi:hypothetical protein